ncbi:hypothetical protein AVEN_7827-1 [Araneus ventricosus]|uniref:Paired domain-containing protein n=1 Tax=Araneus ventricosus TaxID=182803 RepID=A0A4Y2EZS2_ARAVE|nr:hypothetical protein AVEN_7827-1 [Araneus ventricosus]
MAPNVNLQKKEKPTRCQTRYREVKKRIVEAGEATKETAGKGTKETAGKGTKEAAGEGTKERAQQGTLGLTCERVTRCNNRIVMAQRKHLDDFLRGRIIGRLECGRTQLEVSEELGIAQSVISRLWQRFQDDGSIPAIGDGNTPIVVPSREERNRLLNLLINHHDIRSKTLPIRNLLTT